MDAVERVARAAVAEAGALLRSRWRTAKIVRHKGAVDLVTDTDDEVETLVLDRLRHAFPGHRFIAEETHGDAPVIPPAPDEPVWYLDPLDGTTNFAHAYPQFAVSLAFARGPEILLGIVHDPLREETFVARRGAGACLNEAPIGVSAVTELTDALVATGFPYDRRTHLDAYLGFFADFVRQTQGVRRTGSAALDLCYVACGRLDGFWEWKLRPWDIAAGSLIVCAAGGQVSDFHGNRLDLFGSQTLASNGHLHPAMARVLAGRLHDAVIA